jgi:hypothetical protein
MLLEYHQNHPNPKFFVSKIPPDLRPSIVYSIIAARR